MKRRVRLIHDLSLGVLFVLLMAWTAQANPIVIDSAAWPIQMVAEDVRIEVGDNVSRVKGAYVFRLDADAWPVKRDTHVTIYVPVLLPSDAGNYEEMFGAPVVSAGGRRISTFIRNDLATGDEPRPVPLPDGWTMQIFECKVPRDGLGADFEVGVEYAQPHFPGNIVGYVPLEPPGKGEPATIRFVAEPGRRLRPVGLFSFLAPPRQEITVTPAHRKLIRVRSVERK